jgi:hypothetical protein
MSLIGSIHDRLTMECLDHKQAKYLVPEESQYKPCTPPIVLVFRTHHSEVADTACWYLKK